MLSFGAGPASGARILKYSENRALGGSIPALSSGTHLSRVLEQGLQVVPTSSTRLDTSTGTEVSTSMTFQPSPMGTVVSSFQRSVAERSASK